MVTHLVSIAGGGIAGSGVARYIKLSEELMCNTLVRSRDAACIGNSVGSMNAAAFAVGMSGKQLDHLYDENYKGIFGTKRISGRAKFGGLYCDKYVNALLKKEFDVSLGELSGQHIFITAWDAVKRDVKVFSSEDKKDKDIPLWQAVRASMSAPTYFEPFGNYFDGGLCCNDPAMVGADALRMLYGKDLCFRVARFVTSGRQPSGKAPQKNEFVTTTLTKHLIPAMTMGNSANVNFSLKANGHDVFTIRPFTPDYDLADTHFVAECRTIWENEFKTTGESFVNFWLK